MKKFILLSILSMMFAMNTHAQTAFQGDCCPTIDCCETPDFYVKGLAGLNFIQIRNHGFTSNVKTGYILTAAVGYRLGYDLRAEAEYSYRRNRLKHINGNINASSYMANVIWDMPLDQYNCSCFDFQPYVGVGIGYDVQQISVSTRTKRGSKASFHNSKKSFAWQLMTGVSYPVYTNTDMSLEYKFHQATSTRLYDHSVGVGVTYNFGV